MERLRDKKVVVNPKEQVQYLNVSKKFAKIVCPCRILVAGPSLSGKSQFLSQLIEYRQQLFDTDFDRIVYSSPNATSGAQFKYVESLRKFFTDIEIISDLPDPVKLNLTSDGSHTLILVDDHMTSWNNSPLALKLLTIHSHHYNLSIAVTSHNLFAGSKYNKTLFRNYSEIVLLYARSDKLTLRTLGYQLFPEQPRILIRSMEWVENNLTDEQVKYLFIDISPLTHLPSNLIIRTNIFPRGGILSPIFFVPGAPEN